MIAKDGIYESRSSYGPKHFSPDRHVYIQDGAVLLVNTDPKRYLFNYKFFFDVNVLGARIGDLPDGFKIREYIPPTAM